MPNTGNETLTGSNVKVRENSGDRNSGTQLTEPSQIINEVQI